MQVMEKEVYMGEQKRVPKKSTIIKDAIALFVITLVAGLSLGLVNQITKEPIAASELAAKNAAYQKVFSEGKSFEEDEALVKKLEQATFSGAEIKEVLIAKDEKGLSYVIRTRNGYMNKLIVKILNSNENYSIVTTYNTEELTNLGFTQEEISNYRKIKLYDEILLNTSLEKIE